MTPSAGTRDTAPRGCTTRAATATTLNTGRTTAWTAAAFPACGQPVQLLLRLLQPAQRQQAGRPVGPQGEDAAFDYVRREVLGKK